jgi:hypothetical protein
MNQKFNTTTLPASSFRLYLYAFHIALFERGNGFTLPFEKIAFPWFGAF